MATPASVEWLLARADRESTRLAQERPDLQAAVELQRTFIASMIRATGDLALAGYVGLDLPAARRAKKLMAREPLLLGEAVTIPAAQLGPLLRTLAGALVDGGAGGAAVHVLDALDANRIDPEAWLAASLGRDRRAIADGGTQMGLAPDLIWLIGEMAAAPAAHLLHLQLWGGGALSLPSVHPLPAGWGSAYCPTCGSWPALAERVRGERALRCSFCAAAWLDVGAACIYCEAGGSTYETAVSNPAVSTRRLELCHACGSYLKAIDVEERAPFPLVALADLETVDLDQVAADRGHTRPALPDLPGLRRGCPAG